MRDGSFGFATEPAKGLRCTRPQFRRLAGQLLDEVWDGGARFHGLAYVFRGFGLAGR